MVTFAQTDRKTDGHTKRQIDRQTDKSDGDRCTEINMKKDSINIRSNRI